MRISKFLYAKFSSTCVHVRIPSKASVTAVHCAQMYGRHKVQNSSSRASICAPLFIRTILNPYACAWRSSPFHREGRTLVLACYCSWVPFYTGLNHPRDAKTPVSPACGIHVRCSHGPALGSLLDAIFYVLVAVHWNCLQGFNWIKSKHNGSFGQHKGPFTHAIFDAISMDFEASVRGMETDGHSTERNILLWIACKDKSPLFRREMSYDVMHKNRHNMILCLIAHHQSSWRSSSNWSFIP